MLVHGNSSIAWIMLVLASDPGFLSNGEARPVDLPDLLQDLAGDMKRTWLPFLKSFRGNVSAEG
jgi:hypothetical protein